MTAKESARSSIIEQLAAEAIRQLTERIKRRVSQWATEVRMVTQGPIQAESGRAIRYDHAHMPHCIAPMDDADDEDVNRIILWFGIREGKTLGIAMNIFGRTVTDAPTDCYSVHPTQDDADRFSTGDLAPMIKATPSVAAHFVEKRSRETGNTIGYKKFTGGSIRVVTAGALTTFRGTSVGLLMLHELDALNPEAIFKAFGRTTGFANAIIILESTCTLAPIIHEDGKIEYRSKIQQAYEEGDKRKWFCECHGCGNLQWVKYAQFKWPAGHMESVRYHCEKCDFPHDAKQFRKMVAKGKWYPTAGLTAAQESDIKLFHHLAKSKEPGVRSYWRNGFNSLLPYGRGFKNKMHQFVVEAERAKRDRKALEIWTNEIAAEVWDDQEDKVPAPAFQPILDGREDYGEVVPEKALILTAYTDVHGDRLEVDWRAWAEDEESWGMGHYVLFGNTERTEVWAEWVQHLRRAFPHALGGELKLSMGMVDGGWRVDPVIATFRKLQTEHVPGVSGKLRITKGVAQWQSVIYRSWATIKDRAKGVHIGTWCAKSLIYERLRWFTTEPRPEAGFMHFNRAYTDEFIRQCVSENPVFKIINAVNIETFKNPEGNRNEALDLLVGNLAAFRMRRWDFKTIRQGLLDAGKKPDAPQKKEPTEQPAEPMRMPQGPRSQFGGRGWNL